MEGSEKEFDAFEQIIVDDLKRVFRKKNFRPSALLLCLNVDYWLGFVVFGPLIIIVFRGSWQCWDYVLISTIDCGLIQSIMTTVTGSIGMTLMVLTNIYLQDCLKPDPSGKMFSKKQIFYFVASRAFVIVSISCDTLLWKGLWELLDMLRLMYSYMMSLYIFTGLVVLLLVTKSFNVSHCSPLGKGYSFDIDSEYLNISTVLHLKQKASFWLHLLDAFLTVVLNLINACVYHCIWTLVEAIREGYASSGIVMANIIILTIIISLIGFVFQFINLYIHSLPQVPDFFKLASHDFVLAVTLVADVVIFKTIWDLTHDVLYTSSVSEELEALHKMKITGTKIFEHATDEFKGVHNQTVMNATAWENCDALRKMESEGFYLDLTTCLVGYLCLVVLKVSSTLICGVKREGDRYEEGIMVPRYYLTYIFSESEDDVDDTGTAATPTSAQETDPSTTQETTNGTQPAPDEQV